MEQEVLVQYIKNACVEGFHLIPSTVLCESIGTAVMQDGVVVSLETTLSECLELLREHKTGALMVADDEGLLAGVFTERDWISRVGGKVSNLDEATVSEFMTREPVYERADATIAFALNLMTHGGFRHLPIVDEQGMPVGMVSTREVIDLIVEKMMTNLVGSSELSL